MWLKGVSLTGAMSLAIVTVGTHLQAIWAENVRATPVLWQDRGETADRNLYWGPGGPSDVPQPPFKFVKEDTSGTKPKVHVTDARGVTWNVKFGGPSAADNEVHAEIAASRLTWALGYVVETSYHVAQGKIEGAANLTRTTAHIGPDGMFRTARFEKRPANVVRTGKQWSFDKNPFVGTRELSGLKILTAVLGNWDARSSNMEVLQVTLPDKRVEEWYVLTDLGSTFGRMGLPTSLTKHTRWNVDDYRNQKLVDWAPGDFIRLHYRGAAAIRDVPASHARWFMEGAGQFTPEQVKQAFRAAGSGDSEADAFSAAFIGKLAEVRAALGTARRE